VVAKLAGGVVALANYRRCMLAGGHHDLQSNVQSNVQFNVQG
jgi:hypothetical protein